MTSGEFAGANLPTDNSAATEDISLYGKMKIEVDASGAFIITYTEYDISGAYLDEHSTTGQMTTVPTDFYIELHQLSSPTQNGVVRKSFIDNLKISY